MAGGNTDKVRRDERMVSLLIYLSGHRGFATRSQIEAEVEGYTGLSAGEQAPTKRLTRDIGELGKLGIKVAVDDTDASYSLDGSQCFARELSLSPADLSLLRIAVGAAMQDPSFFYSDEAVAALTKVYGAQKEKGLIDYLHLPEDRSAIPREADDSKIKLIEGCIERRKTISFLYTKADGSQSNRSVHPFGTFSIEGEWYLMADDPSAGKPEDVRSGWREFRLSRISRLKETSTGSIPEFDHIDFDVRNHLRFPFAFGDEEPFEVTFIIPAHAPRTPESVWSQARIEKVPGTDDLLIMTAQACSTQAAVRFAIEYSTGTVIIAPEHAAQAFRDGLVRAEAIHRD